jgi:hypothetical protein
MVETGQRATTAEIRDPRKVVREETMCCGYKKCPRVRQFADGSVEISDDDIEGSSVGTIRLKPEQARRLAELLRE